MISKTYAVKRILSDGITTVFDFDFDILPSFGDSQIAVFVKNPATGRVITLTQGVDYLLNLTNQILTVSAAYPQGMTLIIARNLPIVQDFNFINMGLSQKEQQEAAFDYRCMIEQQIKDGIAYYFKGIDPEVVDGSDVQGQINELFTETAALAGNKADKIIVSNPDGSTSFRNLSDVDEDLTAEKTVREQETASLEAQKENISNKDNEILDNPASGHYPGTQAIKDYIDQKIAEAVFSGNNLGSFWYGKTKTATVVSSPISLDAVNYADLNYFDFTANTPYAALADGSGWTAGTVIEPQDKDYIGITKYFFDLDEGLLAGRATYSASSAIWGYQPNYTANIDFKTLKPRASDGATEVAAQSFSITEDLSKFVSASTLIFEDFWRFTMNKINAIISAVQQNTTLLGGKLDKSSIIRWESDWFSFVEANGANTGKTVLLTHDLNIPIYRQRVSMYFEFTVAVPSFGYSVGDVIYLGFENDGTNSNNSDGRVVILTPNDIRVSQGFYNSVMRIAKMSGQGQVGVGNGHFKVVIDAILSD